MSEHRVINTAELPKSDLYARLIMNLINNYLNPQPAVKVLNVALTLKPLIQHEHALSGTDAVLLVLFTVMRVDIQLKQLLITC